VYTTESDNIGSIVIPNLILLLSEAAAGSSLRGKDCANMKKDSRISAADRALFRKSVKNIRRLNHDRVVPEPKGRRPVPQQRLRDDLQVREDMLSEAFDPAELETGEELLFARPGVQHMVVKKLRRGQFSVGAELDLHGMTVSMAREALSRFLRDSRAARRRCVRIIHGKGRSSPHGRGILKRKVNAWLQQRDEVLAFCSARPVDGGTGAVYVLLKRD